MNLGKFHVSVLFEPRDLWVGLYWKTYQEAWNQVLELYICLVPMVPIRISIYRGEP